MSKRIKVKLAVDNKVKSEYEKISRGLILGNLFITRTAMYLAAFLLDAPSECLSIYRNPFEEQIFYVDDLLVFNEA